MNGSAVFGVRRHQVAATVERLHAELDSVSQASVWSMGHDEFAQTLTELTRLRARVEELELRVAAGAHRADIGAHVGATSTASWWAHASRQTPAEAHRRMRLARSLDWDHERTGDALAAGELVLEQARVIVDAVDALPSDLVDPELVQRAEAHLVGLAREHDARALKILGARILDHLAPEVAEAHERAVLEAEEARAAQRTRLTLADDGHGGCHGRFTLPTAQGQMLKKQLLAIAAPRHRAADREATGGEAPGDRLPLPQRLGQAFGEWIERYPTDRLPQTGGTNAGVVVTIPLETLMGGDRPGTLDTGAVITASQARRLACEAGIIPAVLGGPSQPLDLGRTRRFHSKAQRVAIGLRDRGCTAEGCDWPPGLCHVHHDLPWSRGGHTTVDDGRLLCPRHHARAHDPTYSLSHLPGGKVAFTRRT
ncbi:MAG: nuclease [Nocardioides sp.]|nr:nuclease [Nocardioides sp.]